MDAGGLVAHPARLSYVVLVTVLQLLVVCALPEVGRDRGAGTRTARRQQVAVLLIQVLSLVIVIMAPYSDRRALATFAQAATLRYLGLALFVTGFPAMHWAEAWLALILVALLSVALLWRIHDEEAFIHQEFGAQWEAYHEHTWRLIPFLY